MLFRWPTALINMLSHLCCYKIAEKMRTDSVLSALAFHRFTEIERLLSVASDELLAYDLAIDTCLFSQLRDLL